MRVIAGEYRGRKLESFEGMDIRPTSDRVKESLYNILGHRVFGCNFLDLFGGTGSIGIEALSRGAANVVFIDSSPKSFSVLKKNLEMLKITDKIELYNTDYVNAINKLGQDNRRFDIIFIDPPYNKDIEEDALRLIDTHQLLNRNGVVIIEHDSKDIIPDKLGDIMKIKEKQYGNTKLSFYALGIMLA